MHRIDSAAPLVPEVATLDPTRMERLEARAGELGLPFFAISAVTGRGVPALVEASWPYIAESRDVSIGDD